MKINEDNKQVLIFVFIIFVMAIMLFVVVVLIKNISLLKQDPLKFGLNAHGFNYCNCYDNNSRLWIIDDKGIHTQTINFFPTTK